MYCCLTSKSHQGGMEQQVAHTSTFNSLTQKLQYCFAVSVDTSNKSDVFKGSTESC